MQHDTEPTTTGETGTMAEINALTLGVRPVWQILDEAREHRFTGEVVFELDTPVVAYFDAGVVYVAERADEPPLGDRLVDAGVVESDDLRRGAVRVGRVEHLGRLFERLPDLDRDEVVVSIEVATESLITELANAARCDIRYTAYRHHPAGVHRWFAGPRAFTSHGEFAPTLGSERTMIEDLPALPLTPDGSAGQLYIEWDEPILGLDDAAFDSGTVQFSEQEIAGDLRQSTSVVEEWTQQVDVADELVLFDDPLQDDPDELGSEPREAADVPTPRGRDLEGLDDLADAVDVLVDADDDAEDVDDAADAADWTKLPMPDPQQLVSAEPPVVETDGVNFRIELPLTPDDVVDDDAETVPADDVVADAVRRALSAIEQATIEWDAAPASSDVAEATNGDRATAGEQPPRWDTEPVDAPVTDSIAEGSPFAPPTLDMSAEAIYARSEEVAGETERSSALRRLIGGLRRK